MCICYVLPCFYFKAELGEKWDVERDNKNSNPGHTGVKTTHEPLERT